jgi:hypothetical protein
MPENQHARPPQVRSFPLLGLCLVIASVVFAAMFGRVSYGQSRPDQYQIEATYLYDFTKFVTWPAQGNVEPKPFGICVLGEDPFGQRLDAVLVGEHVGARSLFARRIAKLQESTDCQIVFVAASERGHLKEILATLDDASILTVSDVPDFSQRGGMIQFVLKEDKVRFEVNLKKASEAHLTLSSDLLNVALAVRRDYQPGQ